MANRLIHETSPYLLQHADNPVDWYPWGNDALDRALKENKPIMLSIGYAACHWCHVMAHESFSDQKIAKILKDHFISIKVDREERPDLDNIYMKAAIAMNGQGGWPLNVFLTPDGSPFYVGTYFPPTRRGGMPAFSEILESIIAAWQNNPSQVSDIAQKMTAYLVQNSDIRIGEGEIDDQLSETALSNLSTNYDWRFGGWGSAPKFPQPMTIDFLLQLAVRGQEQAQNMAEHALDAMSQGGMYDVIGGGFHRYSTDQQWLVPHFEKMLYDNAQLALVYLHAYCMTRKKSYLSVCEATLDFIHRELTSPQGGFYSSLDADSIEGEGVYYLWTPEEIKAVLVEKNDIDLFFSAFGITSNGNFQNKTIIRRARTNQQLSDQFGLTVDHLETKLSNIGVLLQKARQQRPGPSIDDKVLTSWNGLAMKAFAEASAYLGRPDYLQIARRNASFILDNLYNSKSLKRSWREGQTQDHVFLEDYASLIMALLTLFQVDGDVAWYRTAVSLSDEMLTHFSDADGGFFDTRDDANPILVRPKEIQDNVTPSGNAIASDALLHLAAFTENRGWEEKARQLFTRVQNAAKQYPTAFAYWLATIDFAKGPVQQVALLAPRDDPNTQDFIKIYWQEYRPKSIFARGIFPIKQDIPPLLNNRELINNQATAFVCENFTCRLPTTSSLQFKEMLE